MIDHEKVEQAVRLLLEGIGEDVNREGLIDTPDRIARMYEEIYGGMEEDPSLMRQKAAAICLSRNLLRRKYFHPDVTIRKKGSGKRI